MKATRNSWLVFGMLNGFHRWITKPRPCFPTDNASLQEDNHPSNACVFRFAWWPPFLIQRLKQNILLFARSFTCPNIRTCHFWFCFSFFPSLDVAFESSSSWRCVHRPSVASNISWYSGHSTSFWVWLKQAFLDLRFFWRQKRTNQCGFRCSSSGYVRSLAGNGWMTRLRWDENHHRFRYLRLFLRDRIWFDCW